MGYKKFPFSALAWGSTLGCKYSFKQPYFSYFQHRSAAMLPKMSFARTLNLLFSLLNPLPKQALKEARIYRDSGILSILLPFFCCLTLFVKII